jgi:hypothetical protein
VDDQAACGQRPRYGSAGHAAPADAVDLLVLAEPLDEPDPPPLPEEEFEPPSEPDDAEVLLAESDVFEEPPFDPLLRESVR